MWGKILGTERDYYVAEANAETAGVENEDEERPANMEARGQGVNTFAYWVSNSATDQWILLPDLTPEDIKASREIKYKLSGNLEKSIITNPYYHKTEKNYLRAQIARISFSTTLVTKGMYRLTEESTVDIEENQPEDPEKPVPIPDTKDMANPSNWVHYTRNILN